MNDEPNLPASIREQLKDWTIYWRFQRGLTWAPRGFLFGWVLGLLHLIPELLNSQVLWLEFITTLFSTSLVFTTFGFLIAVSWPIQYVEAARYFDKKINLYDRLSTAVELAEYKIKGNKSFRTQQWTDTLSHVKNINIRQELPLKLNRTEVAIIGLAILSLIPMQTLTADQLRKAAINREINKAIAAESITLDELITELDSISSMDLVQQVGISELLEEASEGLSRADSLEAAIAALEHAQSGLRELNVPSIPTLQEALRSSSDQIERSSNSELSSLGTSFQTGDLGSAAAGLENLRHDLLAGENLAEFVPMLEELSARISDIDPSLAESLAETAGNLETGDYTNGELTLTEAIKRLTELAEDQRLNEELGNFADLLGASQERLLETAGSLAGSTASASGQANSSVAGPATAGEEGGGSGSGSGKASPTDAGGDPADSNPIITSNSPEDGVEVPFSSLFVPENLGGEHSTGVLLPDQTESGDTLLGEIQGEIQPGTGSTVPYQEVFPVYESAARQAIDSGQIPKHLLDLVRAYFSSLEPPE